MEGANKMWDINFKKTKDELLKTKDELLKGANKGIETLADSEVAKKTGKFCADYALGIKGKVIKQGLKFAKGSVEDKIKDDNSIGATVGAIGESLIKQAATSIKQGVDTMQSYIKSATAESRRYNELPEFEAAKKLFMEYTSDSSMQGNETIGYKGVEYIVAKTPRKLCLSYEDRQKKVQISSAIFKNTEYSELEFELEQITEDLLDKVEWLADPSTVDVNMSHTFLFEKDDGDITYSVNYTKSQGEGNLIYTPPKRAGIKLTYTILAGKEMGDN